MRTGPHLNLFIESRIGQNENHLMVYFIIHQRSVGYSGSISLPDYLDNFTSVSFDWNYS